MKNITIGKNAEIRAQGRRSNGNCKPIICLNTGEVYVSLTDAAEALGVSEPNISHVLQGRQKTCKGKRFCAITDIKNHLDEFATNMREINNKANAYDEIIYQQQAAQRAEEEFEKRKNNCAKLREKLEREIALMNAAELQLCNLQA